MIRRFTLPSTLAMVARALCVAGLASPCPAPALAKAKPPAKETRTDQPDGKKGKNGPAKNNHDDKNGKDKNGGPGKPVPVGTYGDWNALTAQGQGRDKTCYALSTPKDRQPAKLERDPAFVFITTRPAEGVRNEVALVMGFPLKDNAQASADIDGDAFDLIAKGNNVWVKNPAKEKQFVEALRAGEKLVIKAPSVKGRMTTDTYSLKGLSQALERVQKECP